ncbi:hypothetical protein HZC00_03675 [Candidatus Kaiserbacteria bacterium]|nr:hypothetical protein [Candidatus Kaiserbacteria bacterium]
MTATPITSEQEKQYKRFVEDTSNRGLKEVMDKDAMQRLLSRGGEFQAYFLAGVRRFSTKAPDYALARMILGKDFISPEEIAKSRGLVYTDEQLAKFGETLPPQEALEWCRDNRAGLMAGPPRSMSLLEVRALKDVYFYSKEGGWYAGETEIFARNDKVDPVWIAFLKEPVEESFNKNWTEQQVLVTNPMVVPNAAEETWCLTTYKAVRGVYLLPSCYVRISSVDSDGYRVGVGDFGGAGLHVGHYWDDDRDSDLGVSAVRKFGTSNS